MTFITPVGFDPNNFPISYAEYRENIHESFYDAPITILAVGTPPGLRRD